MGDDAFVRDARKRWDALLTAADKWDATRTGMALGLFATLNMDRLLDIAERRSHP